MWSTQTDGGSQTEELQSFKEEKNARSIRQLYLNP